MSETVEERGLIPKLRFPGFIEPWKRAQISSTLTILKGRGISKAEIAHNGVLPCIRYGELYTRYGNLIDDVFSRTNVPATELLLSVAGDVIIPSSGETKEDIATAACVLSSGVALGGDMSVLRGESDGRWLSYYVNGCLKSAFAKVAQGDSVVHLYPEQIGRVLFAVPSKTEQQTIGQCLQTLDELIAAETEKLEALNRHKKGLLQQLFPAYGETTPRLRFPQFRNAGDWTASALGQVCETSSGGTPLRSQKDYWNGDIPWITTSLINGNRIAKAEEFITELAVSETSAKLFPAETIVIAMYGQGKTRGKVAVLGIPATTNQACAAILPNEGVSSQFLFFQLFNGYERLRSLSNSGGQDNLSQTLIAQFEVALPSNKEEQLTIASVLDNAALTSFHQEIIVARLRTHKAALMQQLFPSIDEVDL